MEDMRFFPGGNTSRGFYSRFDHIMPAERIRRKVILKGGPGVGKSTFMRRAAEHLRALGCAVEYFHCASDCDSLDGIAAPELGFVMIDGTAPHVVDPVLPGAVDGILNLGECLNEALLERNRGAVSEASRDIARCFLRAYDCLRAAATLNGGAAREWRERTPPGATESLARELADRWLPAGGGFAAERELFSEAFSPQGYVSFLPTLLLASVVSIAFPWGFSPHPLLSRLRDAALDRGIPVLSLYDPLLPDEINHLNFPSLSLSVVSGPAERPSEVIDLRDALSLSGEQPFNRDAHDLLLKRAVECLRDAKRRHDDLEKYYVEAMDYAAWQAALDRMKEAIGAMAAT
ncbi:MAG: hypothetical protein GX647_13745 [Clostridiales bacterium]|jgi:hypothetical protein|nr:hypothetical protein [Clostridiales bacterium]OPZ67486.1 MAG: hypothetical protein BWY81_01280 [Firmicutes bacterium ADurb.Bin467]